MWFWFEFSLWSGKWSISSCGFWPFGLRPLKKFCSAHLPISSWGHQFLGEFSFLSFLYILVYSWQRFSPILGLPLQSGDHFFLCEVIICQSFLRVAKFFEFYLRNHSLCRLIPVYILVFPALASKVRSYIKVLNPFWVDTCTGSKAGI
jgi:hypothetical protein